MDHREGAGLQRADRVDFDPRVRLEFRGAQISSDGGLLVMRELDDALGLSDLASAAMCDNRRGKNTVHRLAPPSCLRDYRCRAGRKTIVQRSDLGDLHVSRQATWGMSGEVYMFGFLNKKTYPSKAEKFAAIDAFQKSLSDYGHTSNSPPDFVVKSCFLAACSSGALLNILMDDDCEPFIEASFQTIQAYIRENLNEVELKNLVRWHNFFDVDVRTIVFDHGTFLDFNPDLSGSSMTSGRTAFNALVRAFAAPTVEWLHDRSGSKSSSMQAVGLICADIMFGKAVQTDIIGQMKIVQSAIAMTKVISTP